MKLEIRIGDTSSIDTIHIDWNISNHGDDHDTIIKNIYELVDTHENILVKNADLYVMEIFNVCRMRALINDCNDPESQDVKNKIPPLTSECVFVQIDTEGNEEIISDKDGCMKDNWFYQLESAINDQFYECAQFYDPEI